MEQKSSARISSASTTWPIFLVVLLLVLQFGSINVLQILTHTFLYPNMRAPFGCDFDAFHWIGAEAYREACPYSERATHPPFFKQLLSLLPSTPYPKGITRFFWANVACIPSCIILACYIFSPRRYLSAMAALAVAAFLSYPVVMLIDRGNIDAWVFLFILGGIFGLSRGQYCVAGTLLACAIASKVYPIVLLAPLVIQLQVRTIIWSALGFALIYLSAHDAWACFVSDTLLFRVKHIHHLENGSLLATIAWVLNAHFDAEKTTFAFYAIAVPAIVLNLLLDLLSNAKRLEPKDRAAWLLLYTPVMLSFPQTVYHYALWALLLLPAVYCYVLSTTNSRALHFLILLCCGGVVLAQFPAIAVDAIQLKAWGTPRFNMHGIPGLGALIVLLCHIPLKFVWLNQLPGKKMLGTGEQSMPILTEPPSQPHN